MMTGDSPLKLWSRRDLVGSDYIHLLWPFWGKLPEAPDSPKSGRFDKYCEIGTDLIELVDDVTQCDAAVLPFDFGRVLEGQISRDTAEGFFREAASAGKQTLVFCWHDLDPLISDDRLILFQTSIDRSDNHRRPQLLPCFTEDFVERYARGGLPLRPWLERPTVGFCGRADEKVHSPGRRAVELLRRLKRYRQTGHMAFPYRQLRARCMATLALDSRVECNFDVKAAFFGRRTECSAAVSVEEQLKARADFVGNLFTSDYVLCPRGAGNFSIRFYETLSAGRIPIWIDCRTGDAPPFADRIAWDRYLVRIQAAKLPELADEIITFHQANRAHFENLQKDIRSLWQKFFEPSAFFSSISVVLRQASARGLGSQFDHG